MIHSILIKTIYRHTLNVFISLGHFEVMATLLPRSFQSKKKAHFGLEEWSH